MKNLTGRGQRASSDDSSLTPMTGRSPRPGGLLGWFSRLKRDGGATGIAQRLVALCDTDAASTLTIRSSEAEALSPLTTESCEASYSLGAPSSVSNSLVEEAVRFAEQRFLEAAAIARELGRRPDVAQAPELVQVFLLRTWSVVMAHARLVEPPGSERPLALQAVVTDLLWSVRRDDTLHHPARLFEMIPGLLQCLREGLIFLGEDPRASASFFSALEALHRPALHLCALRRHESWL